MKKSGFKPPSPEKLKQLQERKYAKAVERQQAHIGSTSHRTPQKRSKGLKKVGKNGEANKQARDLIAQIAEEKNMTTCELNLAGCMKTWPLAPAHRHKRAWYKGNAELLADFNQWVVACQVCHDRIEHDAELTEWIFVTRRDNA